MNSPLLTKEVIAWTSRFLRIDLASSAQQTEAATGTADADDTSLPADQAPATDAGTDVSPPVPTGESAGNKNVMVVNLAPQGLTLVSATPASPGGMKFSPAPAATLRAVHDVSRFRVIATDPSKPDIGFTLVYKLQDSVTEYTVTLSWTPNGAPVGTVSPQDGLYDVATEAGAEGITFWIGKPPQPKPQPPPAPKPNKGGKADVIVVNYAPQDMTLVSASAAAPAKAKLVPAPAPTVRGNHGVSKFSVVPNDPSGKETGFTLVYKLQNGVTEYTVTFSWDAIGQPTGTVSPNDGAYETKTEFSDDGVAFWIRSPHPAPPSPPPPKPSKDGGTITVRVLNQAGGDLTLASSSLASPSAASFSPAPAKSVRADGGEDDIDVVPSDPSNPQTAGTLTYTVTVASTQYVLALSWDMDAAPIGKVSPDGGAVQVQADRNDNGATFSVTSRAGPDPQPDDDFNPPAAPAEPTLRQGDKSPDGWVEYLQEALNHHLNAGLTVDGDFGPATRKAVVAFQSRHKADGVEADGIVGDQTWSFLRQGVPQKPGTDGGSGKDDAQGGTQARWSAGNDRCTYDASRDALRIEAVSVGDTDSLEGEPARIRITDPNGKRIVTSAPLGPPVSQSTTGEGSTHVATVEDIAARLGAADGRLPPGDYLVEAYLEAKIGGDSFSQTITIGSNKADDDA